MREVRRGGRAIRFPAQQHRTDEMRVAEKRFGMPNIARRSPQCENNLGITGVPTSRTVVKPAPSVTAAL
jgi:hypothetical protein